MKYYKSTTEYNCGIDLHSRQMYVCVMDKGGDILLHMCHWQRASTGMNGNSVS